MFTSSYHIANTMLIQDKLLPNQSVILMSGVWLRHEISENNDCNNIDQQDAGCPASHQWTNHGSLLARHWSPVAGCYWFQGIVIHPVACLCFLLQRDRAQNKTSCSVSCVCG